LQLNLEPVKVYTSFDRRVANAAKSGMISLAHPRGPGGQLKLPGAVQPIYTLVIRGDSA
jgi:hypothetical protein